MRNIILILLLLVSFVYSVNHTVTPGNSLHDTINNAAIGDTIFISGGPAVHNLSKAATNMKKKVALISLTNDTIEKALSFYNIITLNGDSCTVKYCNFRWRDSTASTGELIGCLGGNNYGGHFIYGNTFKRPSSVSYSGAKGIYISRTDSTRILPPTIFRNNYCDSVRIWFGTLFGSMPNNVTIDSNSFVNCRLNVGDKSVTRWNYFYQGGGHNFYGDSILVEWNYGGEFWSAALPEYFGNDDNTHFARGGIVRYNYLDSLSHNTVWDGTLGFDYYRNTHRTSRCSYFSHRDVTSDSSKNVRIYENWMSGISSAQVIGMSGGIGSSDIRITRNLFHTQNYTPIQMYLNIVNDTVDSCIFKYVTTMTNVDQVFDTIVNVNIPSYVIDTNKYQFLKQNIASNPLRFSNGRRVTPKEYLTYLYGKDSTASSISFACSLSTQFRYGGRYSVGRARAWLYGDTAQIVVQYATDTAGILTTVNADTLVAGQNANITIGGLPASTKQFYRTISNGISSEATAVHDTTVWYSAMTLGSGGGEEGFDSTEITGDVDNKKECPQIIVQPESDTVAVGSDTLLSFIVQAFGSNLSYQWKFNGANVGSNVNYYQRVGAKADSGKYVKCVITGDTCSSITTDSVLVAVTGDAPPPVGYFNGAYLTVGLFKQPTGTASKNSGTIVPVKGPNAPTTVTATLENLAVDYGWRSDLQSYRFGQGINNIVYSNDIGDLSGNKLTVAVWMKCANVASAQNIWAKVLNASVKIVIHRQHNDTFEIRVCNGSSASKMRFLRPSGHAEPNTLFSMVTVIDVTQAVNTDRIKVYVDGIACSVVGIPGTIPTTLPNVSSTALRVGGWGASDPLAGINGEMYTMLTFNTAKTSDEVSALHALGPNLGGLILQSDGTLAQAPPIIIRQSTDTLKLTCSTDPDNTKQWVVNGVDVLGATDSVLRVPLDSAYYSTNKEIYCRISNGSTSKNIGSWVVGKSGNKKSINRKRCR